MKKSKSLPKQYIPIAILLLLPLLGAAGSRPLSANARLRQALPAVPARSPAENADTTLTPLEEVEVEMVYVEGGSFTMGSPANEPGRDNAEGPQHQVTVSSFYMGKYEVNQEQWQQVMGNNPSRFKALDRPIEMVSWYDAVRFCNALSEKEGVDKVYTINGESVTADWTAKGYRLPTEAEWEYAARGGNQSRGYQYPGSDSVGRVGWYGHNSGGSSHPVGGKEANELGLYDMGGNVWEWCWDWYGLYASSPENNPVGPLSGADRLRVLRGGSWLNRGKSLRSANRNTDSPNDSHSSLGFRLVLRTN